IRKALGIVFADPLFEAMQHYVPFIGATPVACELTGPGYDVPTPADLGAPEVDVSYVDAVACRAEAGDFLVAAANRHLSAPMELEVNIPGQVMSEVAHVSLLAYPDITARATPAEPHRFPVREE